MKGIEPSYSAWKAAALPLSYTRKNQSHSHSSYLRIASAPAFASPNLVPPHRPFYWPVKGIHGRCRIRTYVGIANGFTVRPL